MGRLLVLGALWDAHPTLRSLCAEVNFFFLVKHWNRLLGVVVELPSLEVFKKTCGL